MPNFNLVNWESLDKILKAEVLVHTNGQLKATHLILDYIPISKSFQAPKCIIKARDPWLQRISVAALGFLITGPILEGVLSTNPKPEGIPKVEASSSHPILKEKEKEQEKEKELVEVSSFEDDFEVFDQLFSLETSFGDLGTSSPTQNSQHQRATSPPDDMGIQRKSRSTL